MEQLRDIGKQYNEGLLRIYPILRDDAQELDDIAGQLSKGQHINEYRLQKVLAAYMKKFRRLAEIDPYSGTLGKMRDVLIQTKGNTDEILFQIKEMRQTCEYRMPIPTPERAMVAGSPALTGSAYRVLLSDHIGLSDSVEVTTSRLTSTPNGLLTNQQTIPGTLSSLTSVADGSSSHLLSMNQSSSIFVTSKWPQTRLLPSRLSQ